MVKLEKGQSVLAYILVLILVAVVLIVMRTYFLRAVQDKYRQSADVFGQGEQYAPGKTNVAVER